MTDDYARRQEERRQEERRQEERRQEDARADHAREEQARLHHQHDDALAARRQEYHRLDDRREELRREYHRQDDAYEARRREEAQRRAATASPFGPASASGVGASGVPREPVSSARRPGMKRSTMHVAGRPRVGTAVFRVAAAIVAVGVAAWVHQKEAHDAGDPGEETLR